MLVSPSPLPLLTSRYDVRPVQALTGRFTCVARFCARMELSSEYEPVLQELNSNSASAVNRSDCGFDELEGMLGLDFPRSRRADHVDGAAGGWLLVDLGRGAGLLSHRHLEGLLWVRHGEASLVRRRHRLTPGNRPMLTVGGAGGGARGWKHATGQAW
jgi:hypothetical protein